MPTRNLQVLYTAIPTTPVPEANKDIKVVESTIDLEQPLGDGDFILRNLALSIDPLLRVRMRDPSIKAYFEPFEFNKPMVGCNISVVHRSNNPKYEEGDIVTGNAFVGVFEEYTVVKAGAENGFDVRKDIKATGIPVTNYLGTLGLTGFTGYVGLKKFGSPKKGETIFISAASGAIGQFVGQLSKALGLRVIGSVSSDEKIEPIKNLGFDGVFNYKTSDIDEKLTELCPDGIDIYYDNSSGKLLDLAIKHSNTFGRIVCCGGISQLAGEEPYPMQHLTMLVPKQIRMQGFNAGYNFDLEEQFVKDVTQLVLDGKIKSLEAVYDGIEKTPQALIDALKGKNIGKTVVKISDL